MTEDVFKTIARLQSEGRAYAVATVVRTVNATSAKPGAKAVVLDSGEIVAGWIGSGCVRGAVAQAGIDALASAAPQFVSLRPEELLAAEGVAAGEERDGIRFARNGCPSKGSMDLFVEPVLPQPRLVICGSGPVALALADLAARFDLHRTLCAPGSKAPASAEIVDGYHVDGAQFVVVATQGQGDAEALRAALGAPWVAFVGSRKKYAALSDRLAAEGCDPSALATVVAPAGLDIGAITPEEIALSILAQIVAVRRAGIKTSDARG